MTPDHYQSMIQSALFGYKFYKVIPNAQGALIDYRFLEANPAFKRLTDLQVADIVDRPVIEVVPPIEQDRIDWIGFYGRIGRDCGIAWLKQIAP